MISGATSSGAEVDITNQQAQTKSWMTWAELRADAAAVLAPLPNGLGLGIACHETEPAGRDDPPVRSLVRNDHSRAPIRECERSGLAITSVLDNGRHPWNSSLDEPERLPGCRHGGANRHSERLRFHHAPGADAV